MALWLGRGSRGIATRSEVKPPKRLPKVSEVQANGQD